MSRAEIAASTAAAVLAAGRGVDASRVGGPDHGNGLVSDAVEGANLVTLADAVGLDTLAELWRDAEPDSLAGSLWALYVLRTWCRTSGAEVVRLWQAGRALAPADEVVAGVADRLPSSDPRAVEELADAVLGGAYTGELDVALDRAAAFFRIVAIGRRSSVDLGGELDSGVDGAGGDGARSDGARSDGARSDGARSDGARGPSQTELADRNERVAAGLSRAAKRWRAGKLT